VLQRDYKLSNAQHRFMFWLAKGARKVSGQERRTADILNRMGLIDYDKLNNTATLTDAGREVFA
jgi:hypothetical protein